MLYTNFYNHFGCSIAWPSQLTNLRSQRVMFHARLDASPLSLKIINILLIQEIFDVLDLLQLAL